MVPYYIAKYGYLESEAGYYLYYLSHLFPGEIDLLKKALLNNKFDSENLHRCFCQVLYKGKIDVLDMLYENTDIDVSDPEFFITIIILLDRIFTTAIFAILLILIQVLIIYPVNGCIHRLMELV
jgi:hypothetical protein